MDRSCNMHGRDEKCIKNFGQKTLRDYLEDWGAHGRIMLECGLV